MLNAIIRFSLQHRPLVVLLSLAALVYGGYSITQMPIDVLPDLDRPRVVILTESPGYAAEEVEALITIPLENALNGASGIESIRSSSTTSLSVITVNFAWGTDIYVARQLVQERLQSVELPSKIVPYLAPISSIMGQIMMIGMTQRQGPHGGRVAALPNSDLVAELDLDAVEGTVAFYVWNPRQLDGKPLTEPKDWRPVTLLADSGELSWKTSTEDGSNRSSEQVVKLTPGPKSPFPLVGTDSKLRIKSEPQNISFRVKFPFEGQRTQVDFPSFEQSQLDLRTLADWVVRLRLLKVSGIAQVVTMGGGRKQYQVLVDPKALTRYDVTLEQVSEAVARNNVAASAGWSTQGDKELPIRFQGRIRPHQLSEVPITEHKGAENAKRTITLDQVARIIEGPQLKRGEASVNGQPGVVLVVAKQPHADTRELTAKVTQALDDLAPSLPPDVSINPNLFQMKGFIDLGVYNVAEALVVGAFLVLVVLFLFLLNLRTTFISLTAIPLSLAVTAIVFRLFGWLGGRELTINVMTLGGIAVAMGELVDDAIVDVENIFRRLRENNKLQQPRSTLRVVYEASVEIRSAIVFGTVMVILVFLPLFALPGIEGRLFQPLAMAYIVSILASLLISLTVTPLLSYFLLPQARATHRTEDSPLLRFLKLGASGLIRFSMARASLLLAATWTLVAAAAVVLTLLGSDFLPSFDEGSVQVNLSLPPGSSLEASNRVAEQVGAKFRSMQKSEERPNAIIVDFVRRTGRAELDEHAEPVSSTEYVVTTNPQSGKSREEIIKTIREELEGLKLGANVETEQPLAHLISHMLSGVTAQIAIRIYGDDIGKLTQTAERVKAALKDVKGITEPVIEGQRRVEELHIEPRQDALAYHAVDRQRIAHFVRTAMYGETASHLIDGERRFDIVVRLDEPYRSDTNELDRMLLLTKDGPVSLGMLTDVKIGLGPNVIRRDNVRRRIVIRVNTDDRDLGSAVQEIKERVGDVKLPQGYFIEFGGQFESQQRATLIIVTLSLLSFIAMFVILYMLFPSWRIVLQILNALPTAFIGGVAALALTGQSLTVAGMVGFVSLGGIAARNGILLVSHYLTLMRDEGEGFTPQMIMRGSLERLAPVLMTALTAAIALLPLVIVGQEPGREILYPVATVIVGGLITSTLCEFLIHPGLFWRFSGKDATRITQHEEEVDFLDKTT